MALDVLFGPDQVAALPAKPLSQNVPAVTANCYVLVNVTPYWFVLTDADHNSQIALAPPWSIAQGNLSQSTSTLTIASNTALPSVPVASADGTSQQVSLELSVGAVTPEIVSLSIAAGANISVVSIPSVVISGSGNTVQLAAGTSIGITGTVTVAGSVNVSNTPTVNLSGSGNTVQLAAGTAVSITGTVTVAGSVSVSNTPAVTLAGSSNTVTLVAGTSVGISGTVTIAGAVSISNNPTVNISGSGNTVQLVSGTTVNIGGTATVEWSSTGPVSVENTVVPGNSLVYLGNGTKAITNLAAGQGVDTFPQKQGAEGLYDGVIVVAQSTTYTSGQPYSVSAALGAAFDLGYFGGTGFGRIPVTIASTQSEWSADTYAQGYYLFMFAQPVGCDNIGIEFVNATGGTIASDTITFWVWLIKAQVSNPTANPVQQQASAGSYDATVGTNNTQESVPNAAPNTAYNFSVIASGNNLKSLVSVNGISVTYGNAGSVGTSTFTVYNGSQAIYQQTFQPGGQATSTAPSFALSFGDGVPNAGISITWEFTGTTQNASTTVVNSGIMYAITASTTPPVEVTTVA